MDSEPVDRRAREHQRPAGVDDQTVAAVGKLTEALEKVERARGRLYDFHQLIGAADAQAIEAVERLRTVGQAELADQLERELIGRNVLPGRWTFQIVEEFDDGYWDCFRDHERLVRERVLGGRRHLYEAEMKERERSRNADGTPLPGHEATPESEHHS